MSIPVPTSAFLDDLLTKAIAVGGSLETSTLHLYQNDFTPNKNSVLADFTEADYDGYASVAVTWTVVQNAGDDRFVSSQLANFIAGSSVTEQTIYGWYLLQGGEVKAAQGFSTPQGVADPGDNVPTVCEIKLS